MRSNSVTGFVFVAYAADFALSLRKTFKALDGFFSDCRPSDYAKISGSKSAKKRLCNL
jgi:hypothetical protein